MESYEKFIRYKMILFGDGGVGKTALVDRFVNDKFDENYITTLGYNVFEKEVMHDNNVISLIIYDIGGQEKFRDLRKKYAEGANNAFLVYDITNRTSFDNIRKWKEDLVEFVGQIPFILIGNKVDLGDQRQVSTEESKKFSLEIGALDFIETSAKTGTGLENAFQQLAIKTYQTYFP